MGVTLTMYRTKGKGGWGVGGGGLDVLRWVESKMAPTALAETVQQNSDGVLRSRIVKQFYGLVFLG